MKNEWNVKAKQILKAELVKRDISQDELVNYLELIGVHETKASIASKLSRGTFSAAFLLQCLNAIGCAKLPLDEESTYIAAEPNVVYNKSSLKIYLNTKSNVKYIDINNDNNKRNGFHNTVVSLFSGAGGLDIGLEQAGFITKVCIENDIHCRETLKYNRPDWLRFEEGIKYSEGKLEKREPGDIRDIGVRELLEFANLKEKSVGLVVGGAPCQPFSNIGKREGKDDEKNGDLFLEFVRMVKGIQPKAFIFENVAGITQSKHNDVIKYMIESFAGSGYGISYTILNAANYGVPQRRERFFFIGIKGIVNPAFPLPTHIKDEKAWFVFTKDFKEKPLGVPKKWISVKDALSRLPINYKLRDDYAVMNISPKVLERMTFIKQGENFKVLPYELRPECWRNGKHQGQDTFGRLIADIPSVTIRTAAYNPAKGMYIHPFENRGLDTIEMAKLQDFPFEWQFRCHNRKKLTLVSGGKQIGNAVPPGLARALGIAIKKQIAIINPEEEYVKMHDSIVVPY